MSFNSLGIFRPGVHTAAYTGGGQSAADLGLTTSEGWRLRWRFSEQKINNTNSFADSLIDGIYRGVNAQLLVTLKEVKPAVNALLWPWSNSTASMDGVIGLIAQLATGVAGSLVLTPQASSPALAHPIIGSGSGIITFGMVKMAPENDTDFLFAPMEPDIPVLLDLIAYHDSADSAGVTRLWKWS